MTEFFCPECVQRGQPCPACARDSPNRGTTTAAAAEGGNRARGRGTPDQRVKRQREPNSEAQQNPRAPSTQGETNRRHPAAATAQQQPRQPRQPQRQPQRQQEPRRDGERDRDRARARLLDRLQFGLQGGGGGQGGAGPRVVYARGDEEAPLNIRLVDERLPMGRWVANAVYNLIDAIEAYEEFLGALGLIFLPNERGLQPDEIGRLPMVKMDEKRLNGSPHCTICLVDFNAGQDVVELGCRHFFHRDCIAQWLRQHKTCPMCRQQVEPSRWTQTDGDARDEDGRMRIDIDAVD